MIFYLFLAGPHGIDVVAHAGHDDGLAAVADRDRRVRGSLCGLLLLGQRRRVASGRHVHRCGCGCCGGRGGVQSELLEGDGGGGGLRSVVHSTSGPLQPANGDGLHDSTGWV